jgi:hypothetical protein
MYGVAGLGKHTDREAAAGHQSCVRYGGKRTRRWARRGRQLAKSRYTRRRVQFASLYTLVYSCKNLTRAS